MPELNHNREKGKIAPFRTFDNPYGHWTNGPTLVFSPIHFENFDIMMDCIIRMIEMDTKGKDHRVA